jgi:hypothetical protein
MEKKENYHHKKIEAAVSISPINIYLLVIGGLAMVKKKGAKGGHQQQQEDELMRNWKGISVIDRFFFVRGYCLFVTI